MLRLASFSSSKVVRTIAASSRILSGPTANHQLLTRKAPNPNFVSHCFSTDAENHSTDRNLVKALNYDIGSHKFSHPPPEIPADFPFTIRGGPKQSGVLERELNGEKIYVSIAKLEIIEEELGIIPAGEDGGAGTVRLPQPVILCVKIGKEIGEVVFGVSMCPRSMYVQLMSVVEAAPQSNGRRKRYALHDLEEEGELQSGLQEFLKMRGIKPCYAEFMYRYMVWNHKKHQEIL